MMEDTSPDEQPPDPRFRWGIRIALIIGVAFALALEFRRESPQPLQPRAEDQVAGQPTNAPVITAGFDRLGAYPVTMPKVIEDEQGMYMHDKTPIIDQVPADIRSLNGRTVIVAGFMQPITLNKGKVSEFLLLRDRDTCCFGGTPMINHWIAVKLTNGTTEAKLGRPIQVRGVLNVREIRTDGILVGLYTMTADAVAPADVGESNQ